MSVVILQESPDPGVKKQVVCHKCGCLLEYVPLDIQTENRTDYTGWTDSYKYITCPNPKCGNQVYV